MADTPSFDLDLYFSLPRVGGLAVSPDGRRLVTRVQTAAPDGKKFVAALWEIDPAGERDPVRLTRSREGEAFADFLGDGSILFTSGRPDTAPPDGGGDDDESSRLWILPAAGGEARVIATLANGLGHVRAARQADTVVYLGGRWPGADTPEADAERAKNRKEKGVNAQLFDRFPIRFWDHYLPTARPRLFAATAPDPNGPGGLDESRDLTPDAAAALDGYDDTSFDLSDDGSLIVSTWIRDTDGGDQRIDLVTIDPATGDRRVLAREEQAEFLAPAISPAGDRVVAVRMSVATTDTAPDQTLWLIDVATGDGVDLTPDLDLWPNAPMWSPDGSAVFFTADEGGLTPVWRVEATGDRQGSVTRLTVDGCYSDVCVAPDGSAVYALVSSYESPPEAVVLDPAQPDQTPRPLPTPGLPLEAPVPGRIESITAAAEDGRPIQSWLVVPRDASADAPAPLVVFIHGGPLSAWGPWSWRWNPQLLAERGYTVLLPNPALSTGFGQDFVQRGWGRWGEAPYTDILSAVDAACARPDIDDSRVGAMGGSFGGYMANWVAGHTERFRCIVTHASLYSLTQFHGTTDIGPWWEREFGDPYVDPSRYLHNSPHRFAANMRTPMLVIHGELDHRVPISEALRLWTDLHRHGHREARFLYFPDENHWILKPNNARLWYEVVFAFLAEHVLDDPSGWKSEYLQSLGVVPSA
jgi:dipeptidyl aminopeptidase/acylaminoacyl peptidase